MFKYNIKFLYKLQVLKLSVIGFNFIYLFKNKQTNVSCNVIMLCTCKSQCCFNGYLRIIDNFRPLASLCCVLVPVVCRLVFWMEL